MSSMSNFGRSILEKYGWTDGKGLGRDESGRASPIKVVSNVNAYGFGHDVGMEFKSQWWDHVYNKTSDNINMEKSEDGSVKFTRKAEHEISQKDIPYANAYSSQYSSFVKAGLMDEIPKEKDISRILSYDEMFKLCGGKTAHKGARHGLTMSAKLERVKKQELELMAKWQNSKDEKYQYNYETSDEKIRKSKKQERRSTDDNDVNIESSQPEYPVKKSKKDKKHRNRNTESCVQNFDTIEGSCEETKLQEKEPEFIENNLDNLEPKLSKKERKRLSKSIDLENLDHFDDPAQDENPDQNKKPKKKKKKDKDRAKENDGESCETEVVPFETDVVEKLKKKKKKRAENLINEDSLDCNENSVDNECHTDENYKKKKKKSKHKQHNNYL